MKSPFVPFALGLTLVAIAIVVPMQLQRTQSADTRDVAGLRVQLDSVGAALGRAASAADSSRLRAELDRRTQMLQWREFHIPSRQERIDTWWVPIGPGIVVGGVGLLLIVLSLLLWRERRRAAAALLLLLLVACEPADGRASADVPWAAWRPGVTIADSSATSLSAIGSATAAAITGRNDVVVLDGAEKMVFAFDSAGEFGARSGSAGDGPGEFRDPVGVTLLPGDSLAIADRTHRRVSVLEPPAYGMRFVRSIALDFPPGAACALGSDLYVLGMRQGAYLHRFARADSVRQSFSPVAAEPELEARDAAASMRRFELGGGQLLCATDERIVIHIPELHGEVYGIALDGALEWRHPIDSFVPPVRTPRPSGGIRIDLDPVRGYADRVASAALLGDGLMQVVIQTSFTRESGRPRAVSAVVMRIADGAIVARVADPPVLAAVTPRTAVELIELPVPGVRLWMRPPPDRR